jgi:NADH-quinone oxidoreductase subunit N
MTQFDRFAPEFILLVTAGLVLLDDLFIREKRHLPWLALLGLVVSVAWTGSLAIRGMQGSAFHDVLRLDNYAIFFLFLFAAVAGTVILASIDFVKQMQDRAGEFYALILVVAVGAMLLAGGNDLIMIFIALETTSITQYALAGFLRDTRSSEAGIKYLLLGAISTATLLYGMALLFGLTGTTSLPGIADALTKAGDNLKAAYLLAATLLVAGFGFKMAVFPFQMWVPDVYEGAPTPITAYLSVASKAAAFAVIMRIFFVALAGTLITSEWAQLFAVIAAVSMTVGNIVAIQQTNIKRMFGYSSVAQAGNFVVGLAAVSAANGHFTIAASGVLFYIATYAFTNLGAFLAIIAIQNATGSEQIRDYAGMAKRSPWLAAVLAFCLISLTGLPPSAGFFAKIFIFNAAIQAKFVWLVVIAVLNTLISAVYYLNVVRVMYLGEAEITTKLRSGLPVRFGMTVAALGVLVFGVWPVPLLNAAQKAADVFRF